MPLSSHIHVDCRHVGVHVHVVVTEACSSILIVRLEGQWFLTIQTSQSVNQKNYFEGMVLQNLEKIIVQKVVHAILKKFEGLA